MRFEQSFGQLEMPLQLIRKLAGMEIVLALHEHVRLCVKRDHPVFVKRGTAGALDILPNSRLGNGPLERSSGRSRQWEKVAVFQKNCGPAVQRIRASDQRECRPIPGEKRTALRIRNQQRSPAWAG